MRALVIAAIAVTTIVQQTPQRDVRRDAIGTASISGVVTSTGPVKTPLRWARITLNGSALITPRIATTGDDGRYELEGLPAGQYTVTAQKGAYLAMKFGATKPNREGTSIVLVDGQRVTNANLALPHGGAISGRVTRPSGEPVPDVFVGLLRWQYYRGERRLLNVNSGQTDDRGEYRIFGLDAGEYLVSTMPPEAIGAVGDIATIADGDVDRLLQQLARVDALGVVPVPGRPRGYAPVFHPGTADQSGAATITLAPGEDRSGIDIVLDLVRTGRIEGTVTRPGGGDLTGVQVSLLPTGQPAPNDMFAPGGGSLSPRAPDASGHFEFAGVPPGEYDVIASTQGRPRPAGAPPAQLAPNASPLFATTTVRVNGDDRQVDLTLGPGMTMGGRFVLDGTAAPASMGGARLRLEDLYINPGGSSAIYEGTPAADLSFKIGWLRPGRYRLSNEARPGLAETSGWALTSVMFGARELLDAPFSIAPSESFSDVVVTLTDHPSELTGALQTPAGAPTSDYFIVAFPVDQRFWFPNSRRITSTRPNTTGAYTIRNLPAGDYCISALTDVEDGEWFEPDFLKALLAAQPIRVTIAAGEKKRQDLQIR